MNHLMIDLETMGNKPNAPIVSIGAVFFDPSTGELGEEFYRVVSLKSSVDGGAVPDPDTIMWWMQQSGEARNAICDEGALAISAALIKLNTYILDNCSPDNVQVWGNGATFDNVILRSSYDREFIPCIWKFWNDRDVRTIVELGRAIGINPRRDIPFDGDKHNALADAKHQAKYVSAIWQRLINIPDPSEVQYVRATR
ncbi:3'-5' exonuclease [Klebsiella pneumoniae]|uniref:3'-5' exonuclease n=1 Tax=Klebsiella pneumoniae TaxID=573 RepID=UPI0032DA18FE